MAPCELTMSAGSASRPSAVSVSWSTMDCQNFLSRAMRVFASWGMARSYDGDEAHLPPPWRASKQKAIGMFARRVLRGGSRTLNRIGRWLPGLQVLRGYEAAWLPRDLMA